MSTTKRGRGRPPADYDTVQVRLPVEVAKLLRRLAGLEDMDVTAFAASWLAKVMDDELRRRAAVCAKGGK